MRAARAMMLLGLLCSVWARAETAKRAKAKKAPAPAPTATPPATPAAPPSQPPAAARSDSGGDVVESVALPGAPPPAPLAPPAPVKAPRDRFSLRGWWRALAAVGLGKNPAGDASPVTLPYDGASGNAQLMVETAVAHGPFEAHASGLADYHLYSRARPGAANALDDFAHDPTRGAWEPELREAYAAWSFGPLDLRIGQQRLAWGRADSESPNDVVNARDRRDPLMERELMHLPTPLVRADVGMGPASLQLVGSPVFVPDRIDIYGTNWSLAQPGAPPLLRGLLNATIGGVDPSQLEQIQPLLAATSLPSRDLTQPTGGARLSFSGGGVDAALYFHTGFDGTPNLAFDPRVAQALAQAGPSPVAPAILLGLLQRLDAPLYTATYQRRQHLGLDFGTTLGPFGLRFDGAYDTRRVLLGTDLNGFVTPALEGVASFEYQTGELGKVAIVEVIATHLNDRPPPQGLLFYDRNSLSLAGDLKWTFAERVDVEMRGLVGLKPESYVLHPSLGVKVSELWLRAGAILPWGPRDSFGGWFTRSRAVYLEARHAL